jgi:iron-sulfur cluster assembly protein
MIVLTDSAEKTLKRLIDNSDDDITGLRIMVEQGGCSGMQYMLGLEKEAQEGDKVVAFDGVQLFIDSYSAPVVSGMTIDYIETLEKSGFIFSNPNAQDVCSCGKSFNA